MPGNRSLTVAAQNQRFRATRVSKRYMAALLVACSAVAQDYDVLIRNGRVVDGTGNPAWRGDVAIRSQRVVAMGRLSGKTAKRVIEADGLAVAPGFIDIHNHSDNTVLV